MLNILINNNVFTYITNSSSEDRVILCNSAQALDIWAVLPAAMYRLASVICAHDSTDPMVQVMSLPEYRKEFIANLTKVLANIKVKLRQQRYVLVGDFQVKICQDLINSPHNMQMFLLNPWSYQLYYQKAQVDGGQIVISDASIPQERNTRVNQALVVMSHALNPEEVKARTSLALMRSVIIFTQIVDEARMQVKAEYLREMRGSACSAYFKFFAGLCAADLALSTLTGTLLKLPVMTTLLAGSVGYLITGLSLWLLSDKNKIMQRLYRDNVQFRIWQMQFAWSQEVLRRLACLLLVLGPIGYFVGLVRIYGVVESSDDFQRSMGCVLIMMPLSCALVGVILANKHKSYAIKILEQTNIVCNDTPYAAPQLENLLFCGRSTISEADDHAPHAALLRV